MAIEVYRPDAGSPGGPARKSARDGQLNSWGMCVYTCFIGSTPSVDLALAVSHAEHYTASITRGSPQDLNA
jgi:hypothetical protein